LLDIHDGDTTDTDFGEGLGHVEPETTTGTKLGQLANLFKRGK
jgi:hypothetical protein